jgi:2-methylcitrate dehydratase PrpD
VCKVTVHIAKHKFFDNVSRPFAIRGNPQVDAQFSIPYTVGAALLQKDVFLDVFEESIIRNPRFQKMAEKVDVVADQDIIPGSLGPVTVEALTKDGRQYTAHVNEFKGHPLNPMHREEMIDKFKKCAAVAVHKYDEDRVLQMIEGIMALDTLNSADELMSLLGRN